MFCWLFRLMISSAIDADRGLPRVVKGHIGRCRRCREFHRDCSLMAEQLGASTTAPGGDFSRRMRRRVLAEISRAGATAPRFRVRWAPVLAAACIAIALFAGLIFYGAHQGQLQPTPARFGLGLAGLIEDTPPSAWVAVVEEPIASEIENLAGEAESAVRFLVTCVSVNPVRTAPPNRDS